MPQLDIGMFPTQVFWLIITFVPLFLIIWKIITPRISDTLEIRQKRIDDNLERAASFKDEAALAMATYEKAVTDAQVSAAKIISNAKNQLAEESSLKEKELSSKLELLIENSDAKDAMQKVLYDDSEVQCNKLKLQSELILIEQSI